MTVQHVLVPLDFSATADRALEYAMALAQPLQARRTVLHVLPLPPLALGENAPTDNPAKQRFFGTRLAQGGKGGCGKVVAGENATGAMDTIQAADPLGGFINFVR